MTPEHKDSYGQPAQPVVPDWPTINDAIAKRFPDDPANAIRAQAAISEVLAVPPATGAIPIPKTKEEYIALLDLAIKLGKGLNIAWEDALREMAQQECPICCADEPHTGACGSDDPRALCNRVAPVAQEPHPDYSEMSREALERHAASMAQLLSDDKPRAFWERYAIGPKSAPSCICCGHVPDEVAIQHAEIPSIVVCRRCYDAATAPVAQEPVATLHGDGYYTFKRTPVPYGSDHAGWRMDVYATPVAAQPSTDEDAYVIDRMSKLLAEIAVIVRGPEVPRHRHGYADLPERVAALKAASVAAQSDHSEQDLNMVAQTTGHEEFGKEAK